MSASPPSGPAQRRRIDLDALLDQQALGPQQIVVVGLCLLVMTIDGFDLFMISMALPAIAEDFGVAPAALATVLVLQNAGLAFGGYFAGPLSDRFGRRPILLLSVVGFSVLTLVSTFATNLQEFSVLRMLTGVFLAGVVPNTIALTSETSPSRHRAGLVGLMFCGYSIGGLSSSLLAGFLLEDYGWRSIFLFAAAAGLLLAPILYFTLPESIRFLLRRDPTDQRLVRVMRRLAPDADLAAGDVIDSQNSEGKARKSFVLDLLRGKLRSATLLLWLAFVLSLIATTTSAAWTPSMLLVAGGMSAAEVGKFAAVLGLGSLFGTIASGFVLDRIGARAGLMLWFAGAALGLCALNWLDFDSPAAVIAGGVAGFLLIGSQVALNAFAPSVYPTRIRATGVGWAFGAGRVAAVFAPLLFAGLVREGGSLGAYFFALAAPLALIVLVVPFLTHAVKAADDERAASSA